MQMRLSGDDDAVAFFSKWGVKWVECVVNSNILGYIACNYVYKADGMGKVGHQNVFESTDA